MTKIRKNFFYLLGLAAFFHLFSLICSVYRDYIYVGIRWPNKNYYWEANYWFSFFAYWCTQASLITIFYFFYKCFFTNKKTITYFDKVLSLIVINANIISTAIFTISAAVGLLPLAKKESTIYVFCLGEISSKKFWWFYAIIWHYLAPVLTVYYFARRKDNLANTYSERRKLFLYSFFHPFIYFVLTLFRPLIPGAKNYTFTEKLPHYPYFFFEWLGIDNFSQIFWSLIVIIFWLLMFWISTLSFWNYAGIKLKLKSQNKKISRFS